MKQSNYDIWDLENYKVDEPNKYSNDIDKNLQFDYWHREQAIKDLFVTTSDPNVKQVLRFAMELNNQYRDETMKLYNVLNGVSDSLKGVKELVNQGIINAYL